MATAAVVPSPAGPQRPTLSSAARSSSLAASANPSSLSAFQRQSAVAARLATGNNLRRTSAVVPNAPTNSSNNAARIGTTPMMMKQKSPSPPQASVLKIPSLSTALSQNGTASKQQTPPSLSTNRPNLPAVPPPPPTSVTQTTGSPATNSSVTTSSNSNNRRPVSMLPHSGSPPPPPPPPAPTSSTSTSVPPAVTSSNPTQRSAGVSSRFTNSPLLSNRTASQAAPPPPPPSVRQSNYARLTSNRPNLGSATTHHNQIVKTDDEPVTAVQSLNKKSKETTLGVEVASAAVQCDQPPALENVEQMTQLSWFDRADGVAQTRLASRDLEQAYNQMMSRFLAMAVVAQDFSQRLTDMQSKSKRMLEERLLNEAALRSGFEEAIAKLASQYAAANAQTMQKHEEDLAKLEQFHKNQLVETEERLSAQHVQNLRDLEAEWNSRLMGVKEEFLAQLAEQQQIFKRREEELAALCCTEDEAVAKRVEAETTRFKATFAENDSLRAVLDLRSAELRQLRSENAQLRVNLEDMPAMRERILQLEHQAENYEAVLTLKRDQERISAERQRELLQRLEEEEAEKAHLWRACEVLVFQLQSAGMLPISTPFPAKNSQMTSSVIETLTTHHQEATTRTPLKSRPLVSAFSTSTPLVPNGSNQRFLIVSDEDFGAKNSSVTSIDCSSPSGDEAPRLGPCSPGTESILKKLLENSGNSSQINVSVGVAGVGGGGSTSSSKCSSQGVYSAAGSETSPVSPRSVCSNGNESVSPTPPHHLNHHHLHHDSLLSTSSSAFSTNELDSGFATNLT